MSDLAATNCGGCGSCERSNNGCNCLWILLILMCCGGNNDGCGFGSGFGNFFGGNGDGCGCDALIWILLLSCFCGRGSCGC